MPVPSSGQLRLRADIANEVDGSATGDNVSLGTLSNTAGFTEPDNMSEFYGYTACTVPSVTTNSISGVGVSSMTANGNVTNDNGCSVTQRGFYFGTSSNYASNTKYSSGSGTGSYSRGFSGLNSSTTYYATAYAINSEGESRGSTVSATTSALITYTFSNQNSANRDVDLYNQNMSSGYNRSYGQYLHSQLGWQTTNSCVNGVITNDGKSPSSGLPTSLCRGAAYNYSRSVAYFPLTSSPNVVSSRVLGQAGGQGSGGSSGSNAIYMSGPGTSLSGLPTCTYSYTALYGGVNNLHASVHIRCNNAPTQGCIPSQFNCASSFSFSGTSTFS